MSNEPLTEADIVAARVRAAEGGVPWDQSKAVSAAILAVRKKQTEAAEAKAVLAARKAETLRKWLTLLVGLLLALLAACVVLLIRR